MTDLRYGTHSQAYTLLLHCSESIRHNNIYLLHLGMQEEHLLFNVNFIICPKLRYGAIASNIILIIA